MAKSNKVGRPLSSDWLETDATATALGLTPRQLRKLRSEQLFKPGKHYRAKNPRAARKEYLWHVKRIESLLVPQEEINQTVDEEPEETPILDAIALAELGRLDPIEGLRR